MASTFTVAGIMLLLITVIFQLCSAHPTIRGEEESEAATKTLISGSSCTTGGPLGMESGAIPDNSITASSTWSAGSYPPERARLNADSGWWLPQTPANQWIQVDLGEKSTITGVIVEGYPHHVVLSFTVQYSDTGESDDWQSLADAQGETVQLNGNDLSGQQVTVVFPAELITRFLRISPSTWSNSRECYLRFEILGCRGVDAIVRLVNGDGVRSGRVEIFHNDAWGAVYDRDWDIQDATTVCHQFGFLEALEAKNGSFFGESDLPVVMDRVACKGTENRLADCPFVCTSSQQYNHSHEAGVVCKPHLDTIQLVGGSNGTNGRVEIYRDDRWGTICDNDWDITDAEVVCRQLGFSDAEEAKSGAFFGQGEGAIHMDGVTCDGSESKVTECPSHCWEQTECEHTQDAGVICRDDNA